MADTRSEHSRSYSAPPVEQPAGVRESVRTLHPGYFALVMGTGIVSLGMHYHRAYALSVVLLWLACIAYAVLVTLTAVRIILFRRDFAADLTDPRRGFGMFTFVAMLYHLVTTVGFGIRSRRPPEPVVR